MVKTNMNFSVSLEYKLLGKTVQLGYLNKIGRPFQKMI